MPTVNGLSQAELKLAEIIWERGGNSIPVSELIKIAERECGWKRTTTYTLLKRMSDKGVVQNENAEVFTKISRDEFFAGQSRGFVEETFGGSLPLFVTSFFKGKKLSPGQAAELRRLIDEYEEDGHE